MAVLVLGGAGYIGSHMVKRLVEAGRDVVVVDALFTGHRAAVNPSFHQPPQLMVIRCIFRLRKLIRKIRLILMVNQS